MKSYKAIVRTAVIGVAALAPLILSSGAASAGTVTLAAAPGSFGKVVHNAHVYACDLTKDGRGISTQYVTANDPTTRSVVDKERGGCGYKLASGRVVKFRLCKNRNFAQPICSKWSTNTW